MKYFRDKATIPATVTKVSPYAVYLDVAGDGLAAKLPVTAAGVVGYQPGDKITVMITYLGPHKIVVEKA